MNLASSWLQQACGVKKHVLMLIWAQYWVYVCLNCSTHKVVLEISLMIFNLNVNFQKFDSSLQFALINAPDKGQDKILNKLIKL